jgi:hypothetical protein
MICDFLIKPSSVVVSPEGVSVRKLRLVLIKWDKIKSVVVHKCVASGELRLEIKTAAETIILGRRLPIKNIVASMKCLSPDREKFELRKHEGESAMPPN